MPVAAPNRIKRVQKQSDSVEKQKKTRFVRTRGKDHGENKHLMDDETRSQSYFLGEI